MLLDFEKKVADFIESNALFSSAEKILLAVSGGADSIALLYVMQTLTAQKVLSAQLVCAHINHHLREAEADRDEHFVIEQTAGLQLPIITKRLDVRGFAHRRKLSIETAARKLRMDSLLDIARDNNCSCIATGHQKNDNAETILQRLSRGTGFRGLCGIWPARAFDDKIKFVRPLLSITREEIIQYLQKRSLTWQIDLTNADCTYRRNYIRHRLLPALQQQSDSSIIEQLFNLSQSAQRFYELVCSRTDKAWPKLTDSAGDKVLLNLRGFLLEPEPVKIELIRQSLTTLGSGEKNLSQRHFQQILQLAKQDIASSSIELPGRLTVRREYENLIFTRSRLSERQGTRDEGRACVTLNIPGRTQFDQYLIEAAIWECKPHVKRGAKYLAPSFTGGSVPRFVERFDLDKVKPPVTVRFRQEGDRFWPLGLSGQKKVGKFLTAAHLPQEVRAKVLIVADREKIIWVWPIRISQKAKITDETQKILQLQITKERMIND